MKTFLPGSLLVLLFLTFTTTCFAQLSPEQIDKVVEKSMKTFNVPGMAVAVIKDDHVILKKGYGIRSIKTRKPVNDRTLFGVASNTKAFTSAALAQLVDEGKIKWDTKVREILPVFTLYAPYVSEEFTVRDLLTHRSGLGLGAGDLMVFPAQNTTTFKEMLYNLRYLKPVSSFRSKFDYDNLLYIIAGKIIEKVSGQDYADYIDDHFFKPLGMTRSTMSVAKIKADDNRIDGHAPVNGKLQVTGRTFTKVGKPAAGIYTSIDDMTKWVKVRLHKGRYGAELQDSLFSQKQAEEMWTPQTIIRTGKGDYNTHFEAYGLGWFLKDAHGYFQVSHTGGLNGIVSQVTMIPELKLGIIVLTNQESGAAFVSITNSIKDGYFGIEGKDRIKEYNNKRLKAKHRADSITQQINRTIHKQLVKKAQPLATDKIMGTYKDPWFGKVKIWAQADGTLHFEALKNADLTGDMQFYKGTTFVVRWDERWLKADAFVNFSLDTEGKADGFRMKALSPLTDFSYDFQDLDFKRVD